MPVFLVRSRRLIRILLHCLFIPCGYVLAFALRFDLSIPSQYVDAMWSTLPVLMMMRLATFTGFRVYNGWWRHVGMYDLIELIKAITVGSVLFILVLVATRQVELLPRSIFLLEWGTALFTFAGVRFGVRWLRETSGSADHHGRRALIVGAGDTAASFLREVRKDRRTGIVPVGIVDDDPTKASLKLHGVPVKGTTADLPRLVPRHRIGIVIVAMATPSQQVLRKIAERCAHLSVELRVVPNLAEILHGTAKPGQLRRVDVLDLLGRDPISLDDNRVIRDLSGRTILITGGAGSIGSELARQIADFGPGRLILVEQAESPLYFVHLELVRKHPDLPVIALIADVTDSRRMKFIFAAYRPDYVFHAAAYKHVPMMESNVSEAVRNNIFGTYITATQAAQHQVSKFVLISTDKAVKPSSVMGATKRAAERVVLGLDEMRNGVTDFRVVRFGNVLDSDGSVLPLFKRQIAAGGPVTVTDPAVTRFFMTIPEAVQLVLQAAALAEAGGVAMLEMGRPMRILDLAENLIRLSGFEPYSDIPIEFIGLRPGEKLHEDLVSELECMVPTSVEQIWSLAKPEPADGTVAEQLRQLELALDSADTPALISTLCTLVPECVAPLAARIATEAHQASSHRRRSDSAA